MMTIKIQVDSFNGDMCIEVDIESSKPAEYRKLVAIACALYFVVKRSMGNR